MWSDSSFEVVVYVGGSVVSLYLGWLLPDVAWVSSNGGGSVVPLYFGWLLPDVAWLSSNGGSSIGRLVRSLYHSLLDDL